jgi:hypothetical protein
MLSEAIKNLKTCHSEARFRARNLLFHEGKQIPYRYGGSE